MNRRKLNQRAQKERGKAIVSHIKVDGYDIVLENPKGHAVKWIQTARNGYYHEARLWLSVYESLNWNH